MVRLVAATVSLFLSDPRAERTGASCLCGAWLPVCPACAVAIVNPRTVATPPVHTVAFRRGTPNECCRFGDADGRAVGSALFAVVVGYSCGVGYYLSCPVSHMCLPFSVKEPAGGQVQHPP